MNITTDEINLPVNNNQKHLVVVPGTPTAGGCSPDASFSRSGSPSLGFSTVLIERRGDGEKRRLKQSGDSATAERGLLLFRYIVIS